MDIVRLNDVVVFAKHGASPGERELEQEFHITLEIKANLERASESDTLSDTINYSGLHAQVIRVVKETSYHLLEKLCKHVLDEVFRDDRIREATISIKKLRPLKRYNPEIVLRRNNPNFVGL
jgi:7,8-dihydroneopterin aldolase/epimerase/oxygenase